MRKIIKIQFAIICVAISAFFPLGSCFATPSSHNSKVRKLLAEMNNVSTDDKQLGTLFKTGDQAIMDLVRLLDDPDPQISLRAQIMIRYLSNKEGMNALQTWYAKQDSYQVAGPIPSPLSERDFKYIQLNLTDTPAHKWGSFSVSYIYSLVLDQSPKAKSILANLCEKGKELEESSFVGYALKQARSFQQGKECEEQNPVKFVERNSFFIAPTDRKYTSARLLSFNATKEKALVEIYVNRGVLMEEWYHVVVQKSKGRWKFLSVTPVAVS